MEWEDFKMKSIKFKEIKTQRLHLKPLVASFDFANHLFNIIAKNREFFKFMPWANVEKPESEFEFLQSAEKGWKTQETATYGMFLQPNNEFVGVCTMFEISFEKESGEIGYWLNPIFANKGFMSEAANAVANEFFNAGFKRIVIKANPDNIASCKVAEKCGFEREGLLRNYDFLPFLNKREDLVLYSKIKEK